jgi:hypothetical protein
MSNVVSFRELQLKKQYQEVGSLCLELKKDTVYPAKRDIAKEMKLGYMKLLSEFKLT